MLYAVAAFTGLRRGELLALPVARRGLRRVPGSASTSRYALGRTTAPKSGRSRTVPLADKAAEALERLSRRTDGPGGAPWHVGGDDLVFCNRSRRQPGRERAAPALRRRARGGGAEAAAVPRRCVTASDRSRRRPRRCTTVQAWMGHQDIADDDGLRALRARQGRGGEALAALRSGAPAELAVA